MKIVVGLGNPGPEYQLSRHNAGFMAVDVLAQKLGISFTEEKNFAAEIAKNGEFVLIKPQTFMNASGTAVRSWLQYFKKIEPSGTYENVAVLYDDLDLPFGSWKWQFGTGPKAHNGVNSVVTNLGSDEFWHGRIGTENRENHRLTIPSHAYVLTGFASDEADQLKTMLDAVSETVLNAW